MFAFGFEEFAGIKATTEGLGAAMIGQTFGKNTGFEKVKLTCCEDTVEFNMPSGNDSFCVIVGSDQIMYETYVDGKQAFDKYKRNKFIAARGGFTNTHISL